jgi:hypothetical protein
MQPNHSGSKGCASRHPRTCRPRRSTLALGFLGAALSLMLWTAPVRLSANSASPTIYVYLYTSSGFVNVTDNTDYEEGHVYITYGGHTQEVTLDYEEGHVYNMTGGHIGILADDPVPPGM